MDTIRFETKYASAADERRLYAFSDTRDNHIVAVYINNRDLLGYVRDIELPYATAEGYADLAGSYFGITPAKMLWPSQHLLGDPEPEFEYEEEEKVSLYECVCGTPGCWPLLVRIEIAEGVVIWRDFEQPHRGAASSLSPWKYDALGPFTFDKIQYTRAVEILW